MSLDPLAMEHQRLSQLFPWSSLDASALDTLIHTAELACFPQSTPIVPLPQQVFVIRSGEVSAAQGPFSPGDYFPYRPLEDDADHFRAATDVSGWWLAADALQPWLNTPAFLQWRVQQLERHQQFLWQQGRRWREYSQLRGQWLEMPLHQVMRQPAVTLDETTRISAALLVMAQQRVGSLIVTAQGHPVGMLTETDAVQQVLATDRSRDAPLSSLQLAPPLVDSPRITVADATARMTQHRCRHLVLVDDRQQPPATVGVVSERDLFRLQKSGLADLHGPLDAATDVPHIAAAATALHEVTRQFFEVGMAIPAFTHFTSSLNDAIARRVLAVVAQTHGMSADDFCWLAFGSEGRHEQTLVTDQDNGIVFAEGSDADRDARREQFLALARDANDALAACGFTRCPGDIMASNPQWCLSLSEWQQRFSQWIRTPTPQALLNASIFFDLRPLFGNHALADALRGHLLSLAPKNRIFLHTLAANVLSVQPPLGRLGRFSSRVIDIKKTGTRLFVDAGRLLGLASGVEATATVTRLEQAGERLHRRSSDVAADIAAFETLQGQRLRQQLQHPDCPNQVDHQQLNPFEQRCLFEAFNQAKLLQNTIKLEYAR